MILNEAENMMLGDNEIVKVYLGDEEVWSRSGVKELTGVPPLTFNNSDGSNLIDWIISGAQGGVGKEGINKLKQREYANADNFSNQSTDSSKLSNIILEFNNPIYNKPIPPGKPNTPVYQQWFIARTTYSGDDRYGYTCDDRTCSYQNCQFFANLKAGSYKLVCEYYRFDYYPWILRTHDNENPYVALLDENDTLLVKKMMNQSYAPTVQDPLFAGYDSYAHDFYHEEYSFTISSDMSVGFISKIYPNYNGNVYLRFQIVPSDTVATSFYYDEDVNGVTCWEPYKLTIPVTVTSGNQSQTIDIPIEAPLGVGESISFTDTNINIPTYVGSNTISIGTDINASEMYIKYNT